MQNVAKMGILFAVCASLTGIAGAQESLDATHGLHHHHKVNAAKVTDRSRSPEYDDFVRILWVDHGSKVDHITFGKRAFFTASSFLKPPATVDELIRYVGNRYQAGRELVVMRCIPTPQERAEVQPILATWPNVFPAILNDLTNGTGNCAALTNAGEREICMLAATFHDTLSLPNQPYDIGLAYTLTLGMSMFATPESTAALRSDYGIFPAFTGLGFTVQGSADPVTGNTVPMTNAGVLRNSVVPEYLLKNAALADANCRCVQVPETSALHNEPVDLNYIWHVGKLNNGACREVRQLHFGRQGNDELL